MTAAHLHCHLYPSLHVSSPFGCKLVLYLLYCLLYGKNENVFSQFSFHSMVVLRLESIRRSRIFRPTSHNICTLLSKQRKRDACLNSGTLYAYAIGFIHELKQLRKLAISYARKNHDAEIPQTK